MAVVVVAARRLEAMEKATSAAGVLAMFWMTKKTDSEIRFIMEGDALDPPMGQTMFDKI